MENLKQGWSPNAIKDSKLPFFVKTLFDKVYDKDGNLQVNGVLLYDAAIVYRFHPYQPNTPLPIFGNDRDIVTVRMYQELKKAIERDSVGENGEKKTLEQILKEKKLFGNPKEIVSSMNSLETAYQNIPVERRQRIVNTLKGKVYASETPQIRDSWKIVQERNKDWDKKVIQNVANKGINELTFNPMQHIDESILKGTEIKESFFSKWQNKIRSFFGKETPKPFTIMEKKTVSKEKPLVNHYEVFDRISENFHAEMDAFSQEVAVQLAKTRESVINTPWVDHQKKLQEQNRQGKSRLRPIPRTIPNSIEER